MSSDYLEAEECIGRARSQPGHLKALLWATYTLTILDLMGRRVKEERLQLQDEKQRLKSELDRKVRSFRSGLNGLISSKSVLSVEEEGEERGSSRRSCFGSH